MIEEGLDRIKLAEFRGWTPKKSRYGRAWFYPVGSAAEGYTCGYGGLPDPLTSASDDYKVLEQVRNTLDKNGADWCSFWFELGHSASYQTGDWSRALLRAIL